MISRIESIRRMVRVSGLVTAAAVCCFPASAFAQRGVDIGRFRPAIDSDSFLGVQSSRTPGHGRFGFQLALDWAVDPLTLQADSGDVDVIDHRVTGRMQFQAGLFDRVALGFDIPFVLYQDVNRNVVADGIGPVASSGASNPRFLGRVRLVGQTVEGDRLPEGLGVALQLGVAPPTGSTDGFAADADWVIESHLIGDYHILGAGIGLQVGTRFRVDGDKETVLGSQFQHELDVGIGLKVPIPVTPGLWGILETRWIADLSSDFGFSGPTNTVEGDLGVRFRKEDVTFTAAVGTGFNDGVGAPVLRTFFAMAWAPRVADADGDGVPDEIDQCEFLPEDFDGFEDQDGCLDPDNDNDLIPDEDDRCPNEEAEEFRDEDEDGCTDPLEPNAGSEEGPSPSPPEVSPPVEPEGPSPTPGSTEVGSSNAPAEVAPSAPASAGETPAPVEEPPASEGAAPVEEPPATDGGAASDATTGEPEVPDENPPAAP